VLGGREPAFGAPIGDRACTFRAQVGPFANAEAANNFCSNLKNAGGQCIGRRTDARLNSRSGRALPDVQPVLSNSRRHRGRFAHRVKVPTLDGVGQHFAQKSRGSGTPRRSAGGCARRSAAPRSIVLFRTGRRTGQAGDAELRGH